MFAKQITGLSLGGGAELTEGGFSFLFFFCIFKSEDDFKTCLIILVAALQMLTELYQTFKGERSLG